MSHADKVREAEKALVECAVRYAEFNGLAFDATRIDLCERVEEYQVLSAATCPVCNGEGRAWVRRVHGDIVHRGRCPAKCDDGRCK